LQRSNHFLASLSEPAKECGGDNIKDKIRIARRYLHFSSNRMKLIGLPVDPADQLIRKCRVNLFQFIVLIEGRIPVADV